MGEESKRFRNRAQQCRDLADNARNQADRATLTDMAADLEAEADKIDAEEAPQSDGEV